MLAPSITINNWSKVLGSCGVRARSIVSRTPLPLNILQIKEEKNINRLLNISEVANHLLLKQHSIENIQVAEMVCYLFEIVL